MSTLAQEGSPPTPVIRDLFTIGSSTPYAQIANTLQLPWLTIWNTGSGSIQAGADHQLVGALRKRSFWVAQDDPITLTFAWGQRNPTIVAQPGQSDRQIPYALSIEPLAELDDTPIYQTPNLLTSGTVLGATQSTITPNAGEVYTHLDTAWANAQSAGQQQELVDSNYGQGLTTQALFPPQGSSRQVLEVYGPKSIVIVCGSPTARCDWQLFGVANVVR